MSFVTRSDHDLIWYTSSKLSGVPHGFSTRPGGVSGPPWDSLNLGPGRGDVPGHVAENYRRFCAAIGTDPERVVLARQVHETTVRTVTAADAGKGLYSPRDYTADALITMETGLPLVVFSADCGILLLHDPVTGAVGAVHAGWRGCAAGIVEKAVAALCGLSGADPSRLRAAVGPCIGPCCFETDGDVPDAMRTGLGPAAEAYCKYDNARGKWLIDLAGLNREWLLRAGVPAEQADVLRLCTACHPKLFWSHRKMGDARGAQVAMIMKA
ncbi:MAG: peptidoglycan editing factor PgeF [Oscillibacter sp.]|nr:peptidoglycan editing factor PgeF [Oscillibacter sp.]